MVGMRDVARRAGVSLSTVSLTVNGTGYVAADTRERVERAMRELHYVPNELARNFHRGRTNLIGVTLPTVAHPYYAQLAASLQRELHAAGLRMMLCSTAEQKRGEQEYVDMLVRRMMDGIIMGSHNTGTVKYWSEVRRPVVAFDRVLCPGIPSVVSDHAHGGQLAARTLIQSGVRHVVEIGGPRSQFNDRGSEGAAVSPVTSGSGDSTTFPTVRYYQSFESMMDAAGVRHEYISVDHVSGMGLYGQAAEEVFRRFPDVDAIIAPDIAAAHCVRIGLHEGRDIPRDLQVIAYDGTYVTDLAGLRITAVRQDIDAIARRLVERMRMVIEAPRSVGVDARVEMDVVPVTLVPGQTTR